MLTAAERPEPAREDPDRPEPDRRLLIALVALAVLPFAVAALRLIVTGGDDYLPPSDWATLELQLRSLADGPLTAGVYSRYGWDHPGPLLQYVLAVPYYLSGRASWGMLLGALVINGAAVVGAVAVGWRRGGAVLASITLLVAFVLAHALGANFLRDPWNPYVPVLPLLLLVLLGWSAAVGDRWCLPVAVGVGSFAVQSHVGFAGPVVAVLVVAVVGLVVTWRRARRVGEGAPALRGPLLASVGVALVAWALPVYGDVVERNGNFADLANWLADRPAGPGLAEAWGILSLQWAARPEWIFGARPVGIGGDVITDPAPWAAVLLLGAVVVTVLAVRRRDRSVVTLSVLLAVLVVASVYSVANIVGTVHQYLVRWTWAGGAGLGLLVLWGTWRAVPGARRERARRPVTVGIAALAVALTAWLMVDALTVERPYAVDQTALRALMPEVREAVAGLPPSEDPLLVATGRGGLYAAGIVLQLERAGYDVRVDGGALTFFGEGRVLADDAPRRATLTVVTDADPTIAPGPELGVLVAEWSVPLTADERKQLRAIQREVVRRTDPGSPARRDIARRLRSPARQVQVYLGA